MTTNRFKILSVSEARKIDYTAAYKYKRGFCAVIETNENGIQIGYIQNNSFGINSLDFCVDGNDPLTKRLIDAAFKCGEVCFGN